MYRTNGQLTHSDGQLINNTAADIGCEYYKVDGEVWTLVETDIIWLRRLVFQKLSGQILEFMRPTV